MNHQPAVGPDTLAPRRRLFLPAALLVALTVLAYLPALRAGFIWDDDDYVTNNAAVKNPGGLSRIWLDPHGSPQYYPLVFTVFRIEVRLWGLHPSGFHAINILLHAANALLLWRLLSRLGVPGAWPAALIFAVHPVNVESVAWVTELKNVLSGFFYLAALGAALRFYLPPAVAGQPGHRRWAAYGAAFLLFGCALLSKTVACSLPVAILLILWWKRGRFSRFEVATLLPFFVLGAALALGTAALEKTHVGAAGAEWDLSAAQRFLIAGRALWFYAGKLVWPAPLAFIYPRWQVNAAAPAQYLFPLAALAVPAVLWRLRTRIGRGPLAAALFFGLTLAPALGFFDFYPMRYSFVADHFQYLAGIGLIVLAVAAAVSCGTARNRPAMVLCGAAVVAAFGALTWQQCGVYRNAETLWRDTLRKNPRAWMAGNNLATILVARAQAEAGENPSAAQNTCEEALQHLNAAIAEKPDYPEAYNNRAAAFALLGGTDRAIQDYNEAIRLRKDYADAYIGLGRVLASANRPQEALQAFNQAIALKPRDAVAWWNRGNAWMHFGQYAAAVGDYDQAIALNPGFADAYNNRAVARYHRKEYGQAQADVQMCLKLGGRPAPGFIKQLTAAAGSAAK